MSQQNIDEEVANATGESLRVVRSRGFNIADPLDVTFDPEVRRPLVLDWDSMCPVEWSD